MRHSGPAARQVVAALGPCYAVWAMVDSLIRTVTSWTCLPVLCGLLLAGSAEGSPPFGRVGPVPEARMAQAAATVPIGRIQGRSHISPLRGQRVTTVGIVTAVDTDGLYLQDPAGDGDPHTCTGWSRSISPAARPRTT